MLTAHVNNDNDSRDSQQQLPEQRAALLCIDLQTLGCTDEQFYFDHHGVKNLGDEYKQQFLRRLDEVVLPNVAKLQQVFRQVHAQACEVIHTHIEALTEDGRDRSAEHKRLGILAPPGSELAAFLPEVAPQKDEIVIPKTASGVFISTNIAYVLHNLNITDLYICGVYTNECISSAVRSAADLGFDVTLVDDGCAAVSEALHQATILIADGRYARVQSTESVIEEIYKNYGPRGLKSAPHPQPTGL